MGTVLGDHWVTHPYPILSKKWLDRSGCLGQRRIFSDQEFLLEIRKTEVSAINIWIKKYRLNGFVFFNFALTTI